MQCYRPLFPYDRLSDLPPVIIEKILTLLPIRDAVRTSVLSRTWRHIWTSMPDLNFGRFRVSDDFVNKCLLLHQGPIRKFSVQTTNGSKLISWMLVLSRHHVQQLQINFVAHQKDQTNVIKFFPSFLFNCKKLTHLELSHCNKLKLNVPPNFEGFLNLKTLILDDVAVLNIDRLICTSPLLESISLRSFPAAHAALTISAPKLSHLYLHGHFKDVCLEKTPALVDLTLYLNVSVLTNNQRDCNLVKVFAGVPNLEKLTLEITDSVPHEVDSNLWMKEYPFEHGFMKLKVIEVVVKCVASDIEFVRFMLSNSPVLEEMKVISHAKRKVISSRMLKQLLKLPRSSVQAAIKLYHRGWQI